MARIRLAVGVRVTIGVGPTGAHLHKKMECKQTADIFINKRLKKHETAHTGLARRKVTDENLQKI